jgi:hypothetical protein
VLRGIPRLVPFLADKFDNLCMGNHYAGTIHTINAALIKLSRISRADKLYRGVGGMQLPDNFLSVDEYGLRGGVEFGFLSATTDRQVALDYAAMSGTGIVYEIQQGMGDRGASISWLSQYPHEQEVCFPPVLGLEVQTTASGRPAKRTDGSVVIVELRPSVTSVASVPMISYALPDALQWSMLPRRVQKLLDCFGQKPRAAVDEGADQVVSLGSRLRLAGRSLMHGARNQKHVLNSLRPLPPHDQKRQEMHDIAAEDKTSVRNAGINTTSRPDREAGPADSSSSSLAIRRGNSSSSKKTTSRPLSPQNVLTGQEQVSARCARCDTCSNSIDVSSRSRMMSLSTLRLRNKLQPTRGDVA